MLDHILRPQSEPPTPGVASGLHLAVPRPPRVTSSVHNALADLKELLYELYAAANCPPLSVIADDLSKDGPGLGLSRTPTRVTVGAMFNHATGLPTRQYAVAVAAVLARRAGRDAAQTAARLDALWVQAHAARRLPRHEQLPQPLASCDPFTFGIHRPVDVAGGAVRLPMLPPYVPRSHDARMAQVVAMAAAGASRCLLLVGAPGTGRARSCWEAIRRLPNRWRVWQPAESAMPGDTAAGLSGIGRHTVVWLPEVDRSLLATDTHDASERVAVELRRLLNDPGRSPVLVLATIWPEPWAALTAGLRTAAPTRHETARSLFHGHDIVVPPTFTTAELASVDSDDPRLRAAAGRANEGRVTQFLAGAPQLFRRYHEAPPAAQAIIHAAMDARRFGFPSQLPGRFLADAARDYLPVPAHSLPGPPRAHRWQDEYAEALDYVTAAAPGEPAMLTPIQPHDDADATTAVNDHSYRLATCLDHAARLDRADMFPPFTFWEALTRTVADPGVLRAVGLQAHRRGRLTRAAEAYGHAARRGDTGAMNALALLREATGDRRGAHRLALRAADLGDSTALRQLAVMRDNANAVVDADALARDAALRGDSEVLLVLADRSAGSTRAASLYRAAAEHGNVAASATLAMMSYSDGDPEGAETFAQHAAGAGDTGALQHLAGAWRIAGDLDRAERLAVMAAELGCRSDRRYVVEQRRRFGLQHVTQLLIRRSAKLANAGEARRLTWLAGASSSQALSMATRIAARRHTTALRDLVAHLQQHDDAPRAKRLANVCATCGDPAVLAMLATDIARRSGIPNAVTLARRAAARGDTTAIRKLARWHQRSGEHTEAAAMLQTAADAGDPEAMFDLARHQQRAGDIDAAEALYLRAAARGVVHAWCGLALLHESTGAAEAAADCATTAAQHGDTSALRQLARNREAAGDRTAAADLYRRAGDRGDEQASRNLALLWHRDDDRTAIEFATTVAAAGNTAPLRHLAGLHAQADDQTTADALYWAAYDHGDAAVLLCLPHMREEDHGDPARAAVLALQAADSGRPRAVADLGLLRTRCGDLIGAESLYLEAIRRGHVVDLHDLVQLRLAAEQPPPRDTEALYDSAADQHVAGALLVLARLRRAAGDPHSAKVLCLNAANRADPGAVPALVAVHRELGDATTAALIQQCGLSDDGSAAPAFPGVIGS